MQGQKSCTIENQKKELNISHDIIQAKNYQHKIINNFSPNDIDGRVEWLHLVWAAKGKN